MFSLVPGVGGGKWLWREYIDGLSLSQETSSQTPDGSSSESESLETPDTKVTIRNMSRT